MTRTDPPDLLVSTLYRHIKLNPITGLSISLSPSQQCDFQMIDKLEQHTEAINKRHCRSFDFLESLDDPQSLSSSMEYPYKGTEQQSVHKEVTWNGLDHPAHLRFSSPDLFNTRLPPQHANPDKTYQAARSDSKKRNRLKSTSRVKTTLTPVPISDSPPATRGRQDVQKAAPHPLRTSEPQRDSYSSNRAFVNEVHPIKLQTHSPLYVSDCFSKESKQDPPAVTPHVRCRVDIKPDAAVLQQSARRAQSMKTENPWLRNSYSGQNRVLSVPRQTWTPTPSECYSGDYRQVYQPTTYMPSSYIQPVDMKRVSSPVMPREYLSREQRTLSNPSIPTKLFYTEEPIRSPVYPSSRVYYQDDKYSLTSQGSTLNGHHAHDPRTRWVHTLPVRQYYTEQHMPSRDPVQALYTRPYSTSEIGAYFSQTPQTRAYYGEDPRAYPCQSHGSTVFYSKPYIPPAEQHIPFRGYHTEGRRRPQMAQACADDWYRSSISGYSNHSSQLTPQRVRQEPVMSPGFANSYVEPTRLGAEVRNHSKSWDNILYPRHEREQAATCGRSYDNLCYQGRYASSPSDTPQPVILNLSSSPRRYAALSLSENSLEKGPSNSGRNTKAGLWFVTPEITITDNDMHAHKQRDMRSVSCDALDCEKSLNVHHQQQPSESAERTKDRKPNNYSLQQSLEQLDKLLADLVIDYKPTTSRRPSQDMLDQLKQLINEGNEKGRITSSGLESLGPLNTQFASTKTSPDTIKDPDSGCDGLQSLQRSPEDFSPDHSTDDDETMMCANRKCKRTETLFNARLYFKSCHNCYTFYCSRNCRRDDWDNHKENCLYGHISSVCRHVLKYCRENSEIHKAFSRIAKAGYLTRGRGILFLGFANQGTADNFLKVGLESLAMSPTYLSLRELDSFKDNLGDYCKDLQQAGNEYDPNECFFLNVSIAVGQPVPNRPSPRAQTSTVRKYAKVSLASSSPDKKVFKKDSEMETLILTPPPGTADMDKEGKEGMKAREICFINIQRELRTRGVFLRHEYPKIYHQLCEFVESNKRFTPTTIYPIDKRTGKQFMCMIMAASEPRMLDWVSTPHLLDDII
ncbi:apical junction component 1 homolog [Esox lucius]|uniref:Apical junction molecule ajm1 alpha/beta domain-containing protein n=1 Tax=Esox lucius TaxID=8010 RepID=A0A3P9AE61_ESOLU|nr:apical junction component 1 homolog [Esox lucius]